VERHEQSGCLLVACCQYFPCETCSVVRGRSHEPVVTTSVSGLSGDEMSNNRYFYVPRQNSVDRTRGLHRQWGRWQDENLS
jgi:hypothetical protein